MTVMKEKEVTTQRVREGFPEEMTFKPGPAPMRARGWARESMTYIRNSRDSMVEANENSLLHTHHLRGPLPLEMNT